MFVTYQKNNDNDFGSFMQNNLSISNLEGNNSTIVNEFPSYKSSKSNSYLNSIILENKIYFNISNSTEDKEKNSEEKETKSINFIANKNTPPIILKNEIYYIIKNKMQISDKIKEIIDKEYHQKNDAIDKVISQLMDKEIIKNMKIEKRESKSLETKLGRKRNNDESIRNHTKYSSDNIINKIKTILKKYIIIFMNNLINSLYKPEQRHSIFSELNLHTYKSTDLIKDVDYKSTANRKNKKENLNLLNYSLKQFLSFDLSARYKSLTQENFHFLKFNEIIITRYLLNNAKYGAIFNFVLNDLKFEDFLDIFIHSKELSDFPLFKSLKANERIIIENSLLRIENFFEDLFDENADEINENTKNDYVYLICFLLLIYNFRRYFSIKIERRQKKTKSD